MINQNEGSNAQMYPNYQYKIETPPSSVPKLYNTINFSDQNQSFKVVNSLKARLQQIQSKTNLNQMNVFNNEKKQQLTKAELKQLTKMNQNRELFQMMGPTTNNTDKYLRGVRPRLMSAAGSYQRSRSGSQTKQSRLSSSKNQTRRTHAGSRNQGSKFTTDSLSNYGTNYLPIGLHSKKQSSHLSSKLNKISKKENNRKSTPQKLNRFEGISNGHEFSSDEDQQMGVLDSQNPQGEGETAQQFPSVNQLRQNNETNFKIRNTSNQIKQKKRIMSAQNFGTRNRKMNQTIREKSFKQMFVNQSNNQQLPKVLGRQDFSQTAGSLNFGMADNLSSQKFKNNINNINNDQFDEAEQIMKQYKLKGQLYSGKNQTFEVQPIQIEEPSFVNSQPTTALSKQKLQQHIQPIDIGNSQLKDPGSLQKTDNDTIEDTGALDFTNITANQNQFENRENKSIEEAKKDELENMRHFSNTEDPKTPEQDKLDRVSKHEQEKEQINLGLHNQNQFANPQQQISYLQNQNGASLQKQKKPRLKSGLSNTRGSSKKKSMQNVYAQGTSVMPQHKVEMLKAPQFKIQEIKNKTFETHKENDNLRKQIERFDLQYKKLFVETKKLKEKSQQCLADKFEIMRDLATYEVNTANYDPMRNVPRPLKSRILQLVDKVQIVSDKCNKNLKFDEEGEPYFTESSLTDSDKRLRESEQFLSPGVDLYPQDPRMSFGSQQKPIDKEKGWLKSNQINKIFNHLNQLQQVKRSRVNSFFNGQAKQSTVLSMPSEQQDQDSANIMEYYYSRRNSKTGFLQQQKSTKSQNKRRNEKQFERQFSGGETSISQPDNTGRELQTQISNKGQTVYNRKGRIAFNKHYEPLQSLIHNADSTPKQKQIKSVNNSFDKNKGFGQVEDTDEQLSSIVEISGIGCLVHCSIFNGVISGQVLTGFSERNYKFEMKPKFNQRFMAVDLREEITRLYFDKEYSQFGEEKITLGIQDPNKEGIKDQGKNFLVQLRGCQTNFQPIFLQKTDKGYLLHTELVNTSASKIIETGHVSTIIFEQIINLNDLNLDDTVKRENLFKDIAKAIEENMWITQKPDGTIQLLDESATTEFHKTEIGTDLNKSKYKAVFTQHTKLANDSPVARHSKKVTELVAGRQDQIELLPESLLDAVKPFHVEAGASRTEAQGHKRRGAASMEIKTGDQIGQSQSVDASKVSQTNQTVFDKSEIIATLRQARKQGRMRSSVPSPFVEKSELLPEGFNILRVNRSIDQIDRHEYSSQKEQTIVEEEKDQPEIATKDSNAIDEADLLRLAKLKEEEDNESEAQEDKDIEIYEALYGLRLLKAQKRFANKLQQKKKDEEFEVRTKEEQENLIHKFKDNINAKVVARTRAQDLRDGRTKRKYFRQPKIYQNAYIDHLFDRRRVLALYQEDINDNHKMLFLFIKEHDQAFLLLGREEKTKTKGTRESGSISAKDDQSQISKNSSQKVNVLEMDDDSPYFVKITLNFEFLALLDESLVDPKELLGPPHRCQQLMQNKQFKEIVKSECNRMFNQKIQNAIRTHIIEEYDRLAPPGAQVGDKKEIVINEQSSNSEKNENENEERDSMSDLENDKSIATIERGSTGGNLVEEVGTPQSKLSPGGSKPKDASNAGSEKRSNEDLLGTQVLNIQTSQLDEKTNQKSPMRSEINGQNTMTSNDDGPLTVVPGQDFPSRQRSRIAPQMRKLKLNQSILFERALDEKLESFSVVLNYKS